LLLNLFTEGLARPKLRGSLPDAAGAGIVHDAADVRPHAVADWSDDAFRDDLKLRLPEVVAARSIRAFRARTSPAGGAVLHSIRPATGSGRLARLDERQIGTARSARQACGDQRRCTCPTIRRASRNRGHHRRRMAAAPPRGHRSSRIRPVCAR
jgi:hypothetical protein